MADAPKPAGGGGGWEAIEIIVVIILVLGVLNHFGGGTASPAPQTTKPAAQTTQSAPASTAGSSTADSSCGLVVESPLPLAKITTSVVLKGEKVGCDWRPQESFAFHAQLIDSSGKPVAAYTTVPNESVIPTTGLSDGRATFATTIAVTGKPKKGTGYLILISPQSTSAKPVTHRIPVTF